MTASAKQVMRELPDILLAYGQSDEYSFVVRKDSGLYSRRSAKIMTNVVSLFAASYVHFWKDFFGPGKLASPSSSCSCPSWPRMFLCSLN